MRTHPMPCLFPLLAVLLLSACSDTTPAPAPEAETAQQPASEAAGPADATGLRDAIHQPIDKAKASSAATIEAAEEQKRQIEDAGG